MHYGFHFYVALYNVSVLPEENHGLEIKPL